MKKTIFVIILILYFLLFPSCSKVFLDDNEILVFERNSLRIAKKIDYTPDGLEINMKPFDTNLDDYVYGYYFINLDGETYRYQRDALNVENLGSIEELVDEIKFNNLGFNELHYKVYSLKEYPNHERLQLRCVEYPDNRYCIKYAPPLNDVEFTLSELKDDDFVIIEDDTLSFGNTIWDNFIDKTKHKSKAIVWICYLSTKPGMDKLYDTQPPDELIQVTKGDYPKMQLVQVYYDGTQYISSPIHKVNGEYVIYYRKGYDMTEVVFKYMIHIVDELDSNRFSYSSRERYVLSDEENLTTEWMYADGPSGKGKIYPLVNYRIIFTDYK